MCTTAEDCGEQLCCKNAGRMVNILSNQLKRHFIVPVDDSGLTMLQRHMLHFIILASMHREIYQKDVEAEFHIRKSTATGMMQLLEKNGFIRRESVKRWSLLRKPWPSGTGCLRTSEMWRRRCWRALSRESLKFVSAC